MRRLLRLLALAAVVPLPLRGEARDPEPGGDLPAYEVVDRDAAVVTQENLLASERFWPYQVALVAAWKPGAGARPLGAGARGVLIRVEESGGARIDFGRDGRHAVPVGVTDLLERANRIRRGDESKTAPNFAFAIGTKLLDPGRQPLTAVGLLAAMQRPGFLCVFADPAAKGFPELAAALAPLQDRHGVLTVLFPEGEHPDLELAKRLRSLGWPVPFLFDFLAESYSPTLLSDTDTTARPAVLLQTNEGRVLFQGRWNREVVGELRSAIDRRFAAAPATASAGD